MGMNSDRETLVEFLSNSCFKSPIKRFNFVTALDLTLNWEIAIKLCVAKAHLNARVYVEN